MTGFAAYRFAFGVLKIGYDGETVVLLQRADRMEPGGRRTALTDRVFWQIAAYTAGKRQTFDFPQRLDGTPFQQQVWEAIRQIPYGETATYGDIAAAIGRPHAARAVGMAAHRNPLLLAVPCHRVIGASGEPVGYAAGLAMKRALLALEKRHTRPTESG